MTDDLRSAKRRRRSNSPPIVIRDSEDTEPSGSAEGHEQFTRHADFWLEDGNLILLAGSTAFRIYRGLLVKKSTVFADMFATGPSDATETFDGCPVIRLPDHPNDLQDFLQYLMPCSASNTTFLSLYGSREARNVPQCFFRELHAAIHLAHKYQCPHVEKRALFTLRKYYTSYFVEFDAYDMFKTTLVPPSSRDAIAAVNLARLTDTPSLLPYALYLTSLLEARMMDRFKRRDGSVEHLSAQDLRMCIGVRNELARELAYVVKRVFTFGLTEGCRTADECSMVWGEILGDVERNAVGAYNVLEPYSTCIDDWTRDHLCNACMERIRRREMEERKRMCMRLPEIFGMTIKACGFTNGDG